MGVGAHWPPLPPSDKDQWLLSDQFPLPPTQCKSLAANCVIVTPELFPLSTDAWATRVPLPVKAMSFILKFVAVTVFVKRRLILAWFPADVDFKVVTEQLPPWKVRLFDTVKVPLDPKMTVRASPLNSISPITVLKLFSNLVYLLTIKVSMIPPSRLLLWWSPKYEWIFVCSSW